MARRRHRPVPKEPVQVVIDKIDHEGRGIAYHDGRTVFVDGALPKEEVVFQYVSRRAKVAEARTLDVIQASTERVDARCAHFYLCGGCSLQHMSPEAQIDFKQHALLEQLKYFGQIQPEQVLVPLVNTMPWAYRRRARLGVRYVHKKEQVLVGFREKHSSFLADLSSCQVLTANVGEHLEAFKVMFSSLDAKETIPQVEVVVGDDQTALVIRHLEPLSDHDLKALIEFCQRLNFELYLQPKGPLTIHRIYPEPVSGRLPGQERLSYRLPDFNLEFKFHVSDFTQVNAEINRQMVPLAVNLLAPGEDDKILDLFCGLGNFTLPIATRAKEVVGVEGSERMVERGYENAKHNNLNNVRFYAADLSQSEHKATWYDEQYDLILLDPARSGADVLLNHIERFGARRIVYVSCNPATLSRDAGILAQKGYQLKKAGVMDMFPHTAHVESIALFEK
ncbi:23S rRNA (uracil(1939)-C(5))-methyltransferase RlmD [Piscirickettsia salmonis]|uniref:23S rRNA (uracil(1939)-C(5))-methyltransferase RlmD n=1 Tax=Piscirickettsia salmonis TaxID=1238 RepID=A0A1L6TAA2_PISSA|nr:23S rRNA (uracil(1939)-C(5))-methyltransferase RlmD [Piscirickettsia salmonis]AKP73422.1 23S rRNA methyltransferase [Piscirickettsia salmonis LF-89 = ATCC VR-1361]ALB22167.1 23S rRNA (uracil-5-)-methyltransferase RumA [Piscirickettsia salmonis]ALY02282.1 23S rRNA methyltransferase [Piscirickettsia salmonis]AMA41798.1 23S rRNA methyltransferase [Piscirickettsia salmonis]AOS34275.1 23S rRNA methyltransferase [Piscirickettsia salmonis]